MANTNELLPNVIHTFEFVDGGTPRARRDGES